MRVWHLSDPHLSMNKDFEPIKPMHLRRWALGAWTFVNYLEAIEQFAKDNIKASDVLFLTGDVVHDMKASVAAQSIRWLSKTINCTIIICRGNHDKYWDIGEMRLMTASLPNIFLVDESEIVSIGKFTVGCYSNHKTKARHMSTDVDSDVLDIGRRTKTQAEAHSKIPVMIGHYPISPSLANDLGTLGIRAYMSGHIHCTDALPDTNGINWTWYDAHAVPTDNKNLSGCFCSTGTIDVLRVKNGVPIKEIEILAQHTVPHKEINDKKQMAAQLFNCEMKLITKFEREDPFNPAIHVAGYICRQKGPMQGSLLITHVNGIIVEPQLIYGTPKLRYPYRSSASRHWITMPECAQAVLAEKWNGMNVLMYRYQDVTGNWYYSVKSKGTPFITDSDVGKFLSLTKEALGTTAIKDFNALWQDENVQSITYELCGNKEPHLVLYHFDLKLQELFCTHTNGAIAMCLHNSKNIDVANIVEVCKKSQEEDLARNVTFRKHRELTHRYEYNHFAVEGKVLYLLDENGMLIDRTMYKIKPSDIEEVHWKTFDKMMQGRVREAVSKIQGENGVVNEETIRIELDMGPKEWNKFGRAVMDFYRTGKQKTAEVIVMIGLPGSGKSTLAREMERTGKYTVVNQDMLGSRNACKKVMEASLRHNRSVVVDRCNFTELQRKGWIDLAHKLGITNIFGVYVKADKELCVERAANRIDHPTIKDRETAVKAIESIEAQFVAPQLEEGFTELATVIHTDGYIGVIHRDSSQRSNVPRWIVDINADMPTQVEDA